MSRLSVTRTSWGLASCIGLLLSCSSVPDKPEATHRQAEQTQLSDSAAPLVFELPVEEHLLRLVLAPTAAPLTKQYTNYAINPDGSLRNEQHTAPSCLYEAELYDAESGERLKSAYATVSTCLHGTGYSEPTLYGLIYAWGKSWAIEPLADDDDLSDGIEHSLAETSALRYALQNGNTKQNGPQKRQISVQRRYLSVPLTAAFREGTDQETKYIELFVANDAARLASFNGDSTQMLNDTVALIAAANTIFANSGLVPRLRLALVGQITVPEAVFNQVPTGQGEVNSEVLLSTFNAWSYETLPLHDQHCLLSGFDFDGGTVGLAPLGTMCVEELSGLVAQTSVVGAIAAEIVVHELGHNLSMDHDSSNNSCPQSGYLMAAFATNGGLQDPQFSSCSQEYYSAFITGDGAPTCLNNMPEGALLAADHCGDGIVSGTEECDCGGADCTTFDACCDGSSCTLVEGAACSDFNDLCCASCQIAPSTQLCRPARDSCDEAEQCNGVEKSCPGDLFLPTGNACTSADGVEGACYLGSCATRDAQCRGLSGGFGVQLVGPELFCPNSVGCGEMYCALEDGSFNDCVLLEDTRTGSGVACGEGMQCLVGECVSSGRLDDCPNDETKTAPGLCGCGVPDTDSDGDAFLDCDDFCPTDPNKRLPGDCGCSQPELNNTGITVCDDECPLSVEKELTGACGCAVPDTDSDGDAIADCNDSCPNNPDPTVTPALGCVAPVGSGGSTSVSGTGGAGSNSATGGSDTSGGNPDTGKNKDKKGSGCRIEDPGSRAPTQPLWLLGGVLVAAARRRRAI